MTLDISSYYYCGPGPSKSKVPSCRHSPDVRLHLGYDRWWQQDKEVIPLSQLSDAQVG